MQFKLCENTGFFLRMGLLGPSGSGKTYTALKIATELGFDRIGIVDTENRSARRYAKAFSRRFQSLELSHFSPRDYIEAIRAAEAAGIQVLIIDSLSHAWMGRGGVLEMVDQSARRQTRGGAPNSFTGWREVTPEHNRLVDALVQAPMHLIVTMRVKTEYIIEKDAQGKSVPRKIGLAPVQRDGLEYEFDIVGDLSPEHELLITKSRCARLADLMIARPGAELAQSLRAWVDGADAPAEAAAPEPVAQGAPDAKPESNPEYQPEHKDDHQAAQATMPLPTPLEHAELPPVRPVIVPRTVRPVAEAKEAAEDVGTIGQWLKKIQDAEERGSEEQLDAVRDEMNATLKRRTRAQGETLRRAIEMAKAAIRARAHRPSSAGVVQPEAETAG